MLVKPLLVLFVITAGVMVDRKNIKAGKMNNPKEIHDSVPVSETEERIESMLDEGAPLYDNEIEIENRNT